MPQIIDIKKVTVGPTKLVARVQVSQDAPLMTSADIVATALIYNTMPEIADHICIGDAGEHFRDAMGNTELPHLLEHMTVELIVRTNLGNKISTGRTVCVDTEERVFDITFDCPDDVLVIGALSSANWILDWAFNGGGEPSPDMSAIVGGLVRLVEEVSPSPIEEIDEVEELIEADEAEVEELEILEESEDEASDVVILDEKELLATDVDPIETRAELDADEILERDEVIAPEDDAAEEVAGVVEAVEAEVDHGVVPAEEAAADMEFFQAEPAAEQETAQTFSIWSSMRAKFASAQSDSKDEQN